MRLISGLSNCHAFGFQSVVLQEKPMRRIFIATPKHTLWRNQPGEEFSEYCAGVEI